MKSKRLKKIYWVLTGLLAIPFLISATMKLLGSEDVIKSVAAWGVSSNYLKLAGVVEIICIALFIIPRTGVAGTLLLAAYMGGAIATHLEHGLPIAFPVIFESLVWIIAAFRFPELLARLQKGALTGNT